MKQSGLMIKYPLASSTWGNEELDALERVIKTGRFTMGDEVARFESEFSDFLGSSHAVMFNSGSSANLGLITAAIYRNEPLVARNSSVIVPAVSWSTTFYPINQLGLKISFVDINESSLNIDTNLIEKAITKNTSAIFAVNLLGNPAEWDALRRLADAYNLVLFEDNCESLGASIGEQKTGTFGVGGTFSTFFSHHMSTMEGGLVATDDSDLYESLLSIRAHGWTRDLPDNNSVHNKSGDPWEDLYRFVLPGYNLRPLEMEGALGREQLRKLPDFIAQRQKNAKHLLESKDSFTNIKFQVENGSSSWFGFSLLLEGTLAGKRKELVMALTLAGIESRPIVTGNFTLNPVMKHLDYEDLPPLPVADAVHNNGLFVGNHHFDITSELDLLLNLLADFERKHS
jgi:CDP-6-deoxy-D-xylo-4-hexulose-3-dehydrase